MRITAWDRPWEGDKTLKYGFKIKYVGSPYVTDTSYLTMGVIGEICPFRQKVIFFISTVLTILSDSQDLKPYVILKIHTFCSL